MRYKKKKNNLVHLKSVRDYHGKYDSILAYVNYIIFPYSRRKKLKCNETLTDTCLTHFCTFFFIKKNTLKMNKIALFHPMGI